MSLQQAVKSDGPWRNPCTIYHWTDRLTSWQIRYMAIDGICPVQMLWTALTITKGDLPLTAEGLVSAARQMLTSTTSVSGTASTLSAQTLSVQSCGDMPTLGVLESCQPNVYPQIAAGCIDEVNELLGCPTEFELDIQLSAREINDLLQSDEDSSQSTSIMDTRSVSIDAVRDERIRWRMLRLGLQEITRERLEVWHRAEKRRKKKSSAEKKGK